MNKALLGLIVALSIVCIGGVWMMSVATKSAKKVSDSAFAFVNSQLPPALETWDAKKITPIAHPELIRNNPVEQTQKTFDELKKKLGKFQKFAGWKTLGFSPNFEVDGKKTVAANLEGNGVFEKGEAYVEVTLIRPANEWQLAKFIVRDVAGMRSMGN